MSYAFWKSDNVTSTLPATPIGEEVRAAVGPVVATDASLAAALLAGWHLIAMRPIMGEGPTQQGFAHCTVCGRDSEVGPIPLLMAWATTHKWTTGKPGLITYGDGVIGRI